MKLCLAVLAPRRNAGLRRYLRRRRRCASASAEARHGDVLERDGGGSVSLSRGYKRSRGRPMDESAGGRHGRDSRQDPGPRPDARAHEGDRERRVRPGRPGAALGRRTLVLPQARSRREPVQARVARARRRSRQAAVRSGGAAQGDGQAACDPRFRAVARRPQARVRRAGRRRRDRRCCTSSTSPAARSSSSRSTRIRYACADWLDDGSGFFYSRLREGYDKLPPTERFNDRTTHFRALDAANTDRVVFSASRNKELALPPFAVRPHRTGPRHEDGDPVRAVGRRSQHFDVRRRSEGGYRRHREVAPGRAPRGQGAFRGIGRRVPLPQERQRRGAVQGPAHAARVGGSRQGGNRDPADGRRGHASRGGERRAVRGAARRRDGRDPAPAARQGGQSRADRSAVRRQLPSRRPTSDFPASCSRSAAGRARRGRGSTIPRSARWPRCRS